MMSDDDSNSQDEDPSDDMTMEWARVSLHSEALFLSYRLSFPDVSFSISSVSAISMSGK